METTHTAEIRHVGKNFWIVHGIKVSIAVWRVTIRKLQPLLGPYTEKDESCTDNLPHHPISAVRENPISKHASVIRTSSAAMHLGPFHPQPQKAQLLIVSRKKTKHFHKWHLGLALVHTIIMTQNLCSSSRVSACSQWTVNKERLH